MNIYLLYDPAINGSYTLLILQQEYPEHRSLFAGTKDERLDDVAPYLFHTDELFRQKVLVKPLIELKFVVFLQSEGTIEAVAAHFRPFIYQTIKGREYFFRFWDARLLAKFLPTCDREQIRSFFESLNTLFATDDVQNGPAIRYSQEQGRLTMAPVSSGTIPGIQEAEPQSLTESHAEPADAPSVGVKPRRTFLS